MGNRRDSCVKDNRLGKRMGEKTIGTSKVSGTDYWNKRAEDYTNYIKTSDYNHGKNKNDI